MNNAIKNSASKFGLEIAYFDLNQCKIPGYYITGMKSPQKDKFRGLPRYIYIGKTSAEAERTIGRTQ